MYFHYCWFVGLLPALLGIFQAILVHFTGNTQLKLELCWHVKLKERCKGSITSINLCFYNVHTSSLLERSVTFTLFCLPRVVSSGGLSVGMTCTGGSVISISDERKIYPLCSPYVLE